MKSVIGSHVVTIAQANKATPEHNRSDRSVKPILRIGRRTPPHRTRRSRRRKTAPTPNAVAKTATTYANPMGEKRNVAGVSPKKSRLISGTRSSAFTVSLKSEGLNLADNEHIFPVIARTGHPYLVVTRLGASSILRPLEIVTETEWLEEFRPLMGDTIDRPNSSSVSIHPNNHRRNVSALPTDVRHRKRDVKVEGDARPNAIGVATTIKSGVVGLGNLRIKDGHVGANRKTRLVGRRFPGQCYRGSDEDDHDEQGSERVHNSVSILTMGRDTTPPELTRPPVSRQLCSFVTLDRVCGLQGRGRLHQRSLSM